MHISQALAQETKNLAQNKIKNPHLEAEILLSNVLDEPREFILAHQKRKLSKIQTNKFQNIINRKLKGEPTAYLIGYKYFYGLKFKVDKNVLIPRPETELIVDAVLAWPRKIRSNKKQIHVVDIGTGSGCISISLAKLLKTKFSNLKFKFSAADSSKSALKIACQNAKMHNVHKKIKIIHGNLINPVLFDLKNPIIIAANLPYLTPAQIKNSPTIQYEPKSALAAGSDGLKYYRKLFKQIKKIFDQTALMADSKPQITLFCEIDPRQKTNIKKIIKNEFPKAKIDIKKDLKGHSRLIAIKF
ncbi:MAG: peptide chain release factor N(5)-glutamine methyltransferase [Patescibacteria group bacterium]|nr:peptide chain release factor N(5)-glutamine methyltransferase [Patescibacteria group bacterium]